MCLFRLKYVLFTLQISRMLRETVDFLLEKRTYPRISVIFSFSKSDGNFNFADECLIKLKQLTKKFV